MARRTSKAKDVEQTLLVDAHNVWHLLRRELVDLEQEQFWVLAVDARTRLIGKEMIAKGTVHGVEVHPRDVFRFAVRSNAAAVVVAHNHPSGDPTPSPQDLELTKRLKAAGDVLGIALVDHVVLTIGTYRSIAELGALTV